MKINFIMFYLRHGHTVLQDRIIQHWPFTITLSHRRENRITLDFIAKSAINAVMRCYFGIECFLYRYTITLKINLKYATVNMLFDWMHLIKLHEGIVNVSISTGGSLTCRPYRFTSVLKAYLHKTKSTNVSYSK